eukprot:7237185-Pyramimonas_sp.AAC.1
MPSKRGTRGASRTRDREVRGHHRRLLGGAPGLRLAAGSSAPSRGPRRREEPAAEAGSPAPRQVLLKARSKAAGRPAPS